MDVQAKLPRPASTVASEKMRTGSGASDYFESITILRAIDGRAPSRHLELFLTSVGNYPPPEPINSGAPEF